MTSLSINQSDNPFDIIRHHDERGNEFWLARELMPLLGYPRWNEFKASIEKAKISCQNSQNNVAVHFSASILKNAKGKGRPKEDYLLSRYACYLTALNGDPRKPEVAAAQSYFAIKTREAEVKVPAQSERIKELELQLQIAQAQAITTTNQVRLVEHTETLVRLHGVPTSLVLLGREGGIAEIEKPTIEVIDEKHNVRFKGQTLKQVADFAKQRYGITFKSGAEVGRFLRSQGRDDLIAQTKRSVSSEYIPEEFLPETYEVLSARDHQLLIGE